MAKALVQARGLPLWTAPSLLVRAAGVARRQRAGPGRRQRAPGRSIRRRLPVFPRGIQTELIPSVRRPEELVGSGLQPAVVVGEAPAEILAILESWVGRPMIGPPEGLPAPAGCWISWAQRGGARQVEAVREWEPVYGRPAEAQARWESAHGRPLPDSVGSPG